jgi:tetratricopeptide (TPR) repeat protein
VFLDGQLNGKNIVIVNYSNILVYPDGRKVFHKEEALYSTEFVKGKKINNLGSYFFRNFSKNEGDYLNFPFNNLNDHYYGELNEEGLPDGIGKVFYGKSNGKINGKIKFDSVYFEKGNPINAKKYISYNSQKEEKVHYNVTFEPNQKTKESDKINHFKYTISENSTQSISSTYADYDEINISHYIKLPRIIDSVAFNYLYFRPQNLIYEKGSIDKLSSSFTYNVFRKRFYPYENELLFEVTIVYKAEIDGKVNFSKPIITVKSDLRKDLEKNIINSGSYTIRSYNPFLDISLVKNDNFYKKIEKLLSNESIFSKYPDTKKKVGYNIEIKFAKYYKNKLGEDLNLKDIVVQISSKSETGNVVTEIRKLGSKYIDNTNTSTVFVPGEYIGTENGKDYYTQSREDTKTEGTIQSITEFLVSCKCKEKPFENVTVVGKSDNGSNYYIESKPKYVNTSELLKYYNWENFDSQAEILKEIQGFYQRYKCTFMTQNDYTERKNKAEEYFNKGNISFENGEYEDAINSFWESILILPENKYITGFRSFLFTYKTFESQKEEIKLLLSYID